MSWPYVVLKVLHISAVVMAFGSLLPTPIVRRQFLRGERFRFGFDGRPI